MNGAQYLLNFLIKKGVTNSFGYPGGAVLPLYHAMHEINFPHVLMRHEQGAAHAAEGYARVTGKTGVVFATSGPGATNLVTGLANAFLDSTPIFAVTGQVISSAIGRDAFQEADITGITTPVTKHNYLISNPNDLPEALERAWQIAHSERFGPVLVDITKDVFLAEIPETEFKVNLKKVKYDDAEKSVFKVAELLKKSKKPLILAGGGVSQFKEASDSLREFADSVKIPVATTMMGKGAVSEYADYCVGFAGMHGVPASNLCLKNCDLLLAVGARFSDRVIGNPSAYLKNKTIIHVDIDVAEINKNMPVDLGVNLKSDVFLDELLKHSDELKNLWTPWYNQALEWKVKHDIKPDKSDNLLPQEIISLANKYAGKDGITVTDVGQNQMFAAQHYKTENCMSFVTSGGLGTMGFGLPASIGAAVALNMDCETYISGENPSQKGRTITLFVGDGGLQMTIQELAIVSKLNLPLKIFLLDNACLGMVRQWQELFHDMKYSHTMLYHNPDFSELAKAYGLSTIKIENSDNLEEKIKEIYSAPGSQFIHCVVHKTENVFPMVPPGGNPENMRGMGGVSYE